MQILEMETLSGKIGAILGKINVMAEHACNNLLSQKFSFLSGSFL